MPLDRPEKKHQYLECFETIPANITFSPTYLRAGSVRAAGLYTGAHSGPLLGGK
jgi:hypothetical protein